MKANARPNIVLVFADQMRSTAMGCGGVEQVRTPNLDAFAGQGTRFTNALSNTPSCAPARACLLTGLHTLTHRLVGNDSPLRTDVRSIAHCLNDAGYRCGYIGKWHMDVADRGAFIPPGPRRQGFDDYWAVANCEHYYFAAHYYLNDDPEPKWFDCYQPEGQTELALQYIRSRAADDKPFMLALSWSPPHCPYEKVPKRFLDSYPPDSIELLPNAAAEAKKEVIAGYYAHVTALDELFGKLTSAIDAAGIASNTIVIFTSDHGDMLYSQNRGWKGKPWRESVGIPLIIRWPGHVPAGRVTHGPISLVDLMPTLLSMAGAEIPKEVEGEDLKAFVCGDEHAAADSVFINFPVCPTICSFKAWRGVVSGRYTYARFQDRPWILYDDLADPFQLHNLAESPGHQPLRDQMEAHLQKWLALTNDRFEGSEVLADRYYPGHVNHMIPYCCNDKVQAGRRARAGRTY